MKDHSVSGGKVALFIELTVVPASGKLGLFWDKSGRIKCNLKAVAEKGKANKELIQFISKLIKVPQQEIVIISGETDRKKRIKIDREITMDQFLALCGLAVQKTLF